MLSQATATQTLQIETWHIDHFVPYARNPRKNDAAVDRMCASIREFGFKVPVLARSDGAVVDGHDETAMRAISRRVDRLEEQLRPTAAERRLTIQLGNLRTLPADYTGPRHVVNREATATGFKGQRLV